MAVNSLTRDTLTNTVKYTSLLAGNEPFDYSSDFLITESILTSNSASVTFDLSTLAAEGYKHLQFRVVARSTAALSRSSFHYRLNSDASTNYTVHNLYGFGTSLASGNGLGQTKGDLGWIPAANATSTIFGSVITNLIDAFSSTKNKSFQTISQVQTDNLVGLTTSLWISNSATTSITFLCADGSIASGSRISIYGSKG